MLCYARHARLVAPLNETLRWLGKMEPRLAPPQPGGQPIAEAAAACRTLPPSAPVQSCWDRLLGANLSTNLSTTQPQPRPMSWTPSAHANSVGK